MTIDDLTKCYEAAENAELTARLLPDFLAGGEEWQEYGVCHTADGDIAVIAYYYFEAEEIEALADVDSLPEYYPWDAAHIMYIADREDVPLAGRDIAGFRA
jgi:hypothetical protein